MDDPAVIDAFIGHLRKDAYPTLKITYRPDERNRKTSDVDAIAGPFAIEHTSVDTIAFQRRDSEWFVQVVGGLEDEFTNKLSYRLSITIPYEGVQIGQDWLAVRSSFRSWIAHDSLDFRDGVHTIRQAPGIPFEFIVKKDTGRKPRLLFARLAPIDHSLPDRLREQLTKKAQKLAPYKRRGYVTILLIESDDIALMNEETMLDALRVGLCRSLPEGVDTLWYVDTALPDELVFHDFTEAIRQ